METGQDRFLKNQSIKFKKFKKIQKNEIENSKKTRVHFKIIGLNRIKNSKSIDVQNSEKRKLKEKSGK
jgi:hypothetical protein